MKLPSIPKIPKVPKLNPAELRDKLPFQPRREFVMHDSEHPDDGTGMHYRPSTGYVPPQAPAAPAAAPVNYGNVDHQMPFRQEMVYPGGQARTPYAAGGQARQEYTGSWPPPPAYPQRQEPVQPSVAYTQPEQPAMDPMFAQAEYYVPRANYRPAPEYAQPRVYPQQPPRQAYAPPQGYPSQPEAPRTAPAQKPPKAKETKAGFVVTAAALLGSLLPRKKPAAKKSSQPQSHGQPNAYRPAPQPQRTMSAGEMKYFIWAGSIAAGLLLTVVSFIYACAA